MFTKKENATLAQRIEILDWFHKNGENQSATARHFRPIFPNLQIKQPLISSWVKEEAKWRDLWEQGNQKSDQMAKRTRQTEHPEVTEMMYLWVSKAMGDGILLTGEVLRQKWNKFADLAGIPEDERLKLSNGWLDTFKGRVGLKQSRRHGEAGSTPADTVDGERKRMQELITQTGYKLRDIFNMDETGLFYGYASVSNFALMLSNVIHRMIPDKGLSNCKRSGVKGKKVRLTYAFTENADGSEKLPAFIIGKAARPRPFNKKTGDQLGFYYRSNAKAWMTAHLYQDWLERWDIDLQKTKRKILLLQDNFSGHIVPSNLQCIRVENFEPNLTAHVQPNDQGIIRCFKAHYRRRFIHRAIDRYDEGISPSEIYEINQLQAMRIAEAAWQDVDTTTIRKCWQKAGIVPDVAAPSASTQPTIPISALLNNSASQTDPIAHAESQVEQALDDLVATGVLQKENRMDINSLLNPVGESHVLTETSDQEIYQAVMDAVEARENIEMSGGDDGDGDTVEPNPTRRDVLKAASTISDYIGTINDPLARKIEVLLGSFKRQLHLHEAKTMKDTVLTDYFS